MFPVQSDGLGEIRPLHHSECHREGVELLQQRQRRGVGSRQAQRLCRGCNTSLIEGDHRSFEAWGAARGLVRHMDRDATYRRRVRGSEYSARARSRESGPAWRTCVCIALAYARPGGRSGSAYPREQAQRSSSTEVAARPIRAVPAPPVRKF